MMQHDAAGKGHKNAKSTLAPVNPEDIELGKRSFESTHRIFSGHEHAYDVSATKISSYDDPGFLNLPDPPAIHVRNDVSVRSQI